MSELWLFRIGVEALFQFTQKFVQIALSFRLVSERTDFLTCVGLVIPEIVLTVDLCLLILGSSWFICIDVSFFMSFCPVSEDPVFAKASATG